jgi:hypothetical protein
MRMNNPMHIPCHTDIEPEGTELTDEDMDNISAFALHLEGSGIPRSTYQHLQNFFQCKLNIDTEYLMYCRMEMLSGVKPTFHDMCSNSCCLFVGPFAAASHCPFCQITCYHPNGRPIARFSYIPMIPRFQAWYQSMPMIDHLAKRHRMEAEVEAGGSGVRSSGAMAGVRSGGVTTGVGGRGNTTGARATREPSVNTTVGQLIQLVAAQSEHMAWLETQVERVVDGLERQLGRIGDQLEWIMGVLERAEGWGARRGNRSADERPRNQSEWRRADQLPGPLLIID